MNQETKLTKFTSNVTIGTAISRILGYIRDMLVAQLFGASIVADAFYAAYRIPNLFRRLLGEGAMSASFIPVFTEYSEKKDKKDTQELLNIVFTTLLTILVIITLGGIVLARPLTKLIAWGFTYVPEKMELTIILTRILFPYLTFVCLAALMLGVLNSLKSFFIPAVAPAALSVSEIVYILFFAILMVSVDKSATAIQFEQVKWLSVSIIIGGLGQYLLQQVWVLRRGFKLNLKYDFNHPGLRKIFFLMVPVMIGFSVDQINAFADTICASFLQHGSITALYYSSRLMQLPLALFGLAITTVALPIMSSGVAKNDIEKVKNTLNFSLRMICFTIIPCIFGLIVLGLPIIKLLFERGRFDAQASLLTYRALAFYSLGLLAYSSVKILASAFYSFKETRIPLKVAVICMVLNIILNIILMKPLGVGGLALATAISSWTNAIFLFYVLRKRIGPFGGKQIFDVFLKVIFVSCIMAVFAYLLYTIKYPYFILKVCIPIICAVILYFVLSKLAKINEYKLILDLFKK